MKLDRECRCPSYPWPHEFGVGDCGDRLVKRERDEDADPISRWTGDDYTADHAADDPRRGQAAGLNAMRRIP